MSGISKRPRRPLPSRNGWIKEKPYLLFTGKINKRWSYVGNLKLSRNGILYLPKASPQ
jgi:hypothetical protein